LAKSGKLAVIGSETLMGREIRDVVATSGLPFELKLFTDEPAQSGKLTEQSGEPALVWGLDLASLSETPVAILAGARESARKVLELAPPTHLIDLTHAAEENPRARLRAPRLEPPDYQASADAVHVVAHPAAIAIATAFERLHARHPVRRSLVHIFEPASERGNAGLEELQQQSVGLLSFKPLPKAIFDAQLSFNLLARYGEEAPESLEHIELRIERDLASLLAFAPGGPPMPSLRLVQAPVFHGYSFSVWVEFVENPGVPGLEKALQGGGLEVRGSNLEPPTNVGIAGDPDVAVGAITPDRNHPQAAWFWMVADNLRLAAVNAVAVAHQLL
jgi:aspartate-semialdehyde dehydrogenase